MTHRTRARHHDVRTTLDAWIDLAAQTDRTGDDLDVTL